MPISYTKRGWTNNSPPAINAANLGAMDDGLKNAIDALNNMGDAGQQAVKEIGAAPASTTGGKLVNKITEAGYSLAPATGTSNLDNIADGTSYKRIQAAKADALNTLGSLVANYRIFVKNDASGLEFAAGSKYIEASRDMATDSGTQAITGVGFKPSAAIIFAYMSGLGKASWGLLGPGGRNALYISSGVFSATFGNIVYIKQDASNYNYATLSSLDTDGLTLNWTKVGAQTGTAYMLILAIR